MAMTSYLDDFNVDAETKQVPDLALEMTRTALGLADDFANGIIAKRISEIAETGERDPDLCEGAVRNYAGICLETNRTNRPNARSPPQPHLLAPLRFREVPESIIEPTAGRLRASVGLQASGRRLGCLIRSRRGFDLARSGATRCSA